MKQAARVVSAFCGRHPLFIAGICVVACIVLADIDGRLGFAMAACLSLFGFLDGNWRRGFILALICAVAVGIFQQRNAHRDQLAEAMLQRGHAELKGRVLDSASGTGRYWSAPVEVTEGPFAGAKVDWSGSGEIPVTGAMVQAGGDFLPLPEPRNPGEFDEAAWLRREGISAVFEASRWRQIVVQTGAWAKLAQRIRVGFRQGITAGLDEQSQEARVIRAVVMGDHPRDSDELLDAFRSSGTLHLFSVSGMHVAMVAGIAWLLLRVVRVPRRTAVLALIPLVFGYAWITGNGSPAVRAAWMASVFLMAFVWKRRPDLLNVLGAVLLGMLLWNGNLIFQAGAQLSYGVVAVIAIGTAWAMRAFSWMGAEENYLPSELMGKWRAGGLWIRRRTAQSLAVSTAAWIGSTPLTIWHFRLLTPVSIIANLPLILIVYPMMALALLSAVLHPFSSRAAAWTTQGTASLANVCVATAAWFGRLPASHFQIPAKGSAQLLIYDLKYGAGAGCFSGGWGEGAVLMDCGDRNSFQYRIAPSLRRLGISPDSVVLSHPDGSHIATQPMVRETFPIKQVLLPVELARSPAYRTWLSDTHGDLKKRFVQETAGLNFPDGAWLECLNTPPSRAQNIMADNRVAVYRLHWRNWEILFMSDAGDVIEQQLLKSGKDLSADLVIVGRHPTDSHLGDRFLDRVKPKAIIASNASYPAEERLKPEEIDYWSSRGIQVIDQGKTGGVTVRIGSDGELWVDGFVDQSSLRLTH